MTHDDVPTHLIKSEYFTADLQLKCFATRNLVPTDVYLNINDTSKVDRYTPQCDAGSRIQLMAYTYQHREYGTDQTYVVTTEEPFLPKQEYLVHELCSFKEKCENMTRLLESDQHDPRTNVIRLQYQCRGKTDK